MLLTDLLIGILLLFVLRVSARLVKLIPSDRPYAKVLVYLFPVIEFTLWALFLFWVLFHLFEGEFYYTTLIISLILVLVGLLSWFVIKDFMVGLIFKTENVFRVNNTIRVADTQGIIRRLGYLSLDLENENGELEKIRYSKLSGQRVVKPNPTEALKKYTFFLEYPNHVPISKAMHAITHHILNAPWSAVSKAPVIQNAGSNEKTYRFEVAVYALIPSHADAIEMYVKKQLFSKP